MSTPDDRPRPSPPPLGEAIQARPVLSVPAGDDVSAPEPANDPAETPDADSHFPSPLVDQNIFERVHGPYWSIVWLVLAVACVGFLFTATSDGRVAFAILAPMALALAIVSSFDWFRPRRFCVRSDGFECTRPRQFVRFDEMRDVFRTEAKKGPDGIRIVFGRGSIAIPPRLTCDTDELFRLLRSRVRPRVGLPPTPPIFDAFLKQQSMLYSAENIHVFRGSPHPMRPTTGRAFFKLTIALLLPIPLWTCLAIAYPKTEAFVIMAVLFGILAFLFGLIAVGSLFNRPRVKNAEDAVLIVTPAGLALSQADLRGELRWSEVQKIGAGTPGGFQWTSQPTGMLLRVKGAEILVADIYDWPIEYIHTLVRRYSGR